MRFIFPPHAASGSKILPSDLPNYEKAGWLAQFKFNGTHVVAWSDGKDADIRDRRGNVLSTYRLTPAMRSLLCDLGRDQEVVVAGELLHTKAKVAATGRQAANNTIVLFDILYHGKNLLDITQTDRLQLLSRIVGEPSTLETKGRALVVGQLGEADLWLAETFTDEFEYRFYQFFDFDRDGKDRFPEIEGLMLRLANSKLDRVGDRLYDCRWLVRCRKLKEKIYPF